MVAISRILGGSPAKLTADVDIDGLPYDVTATVLVDAVTGHPKVDELSLRRRPGGPCPVGPPTKAARKRDSDDDLSRGSHGSHDHD